MIIGVAVAPTTPLVLPGLPGRPHPGIASLGVASRRVTEGLGRAGVVVVLAGGPRLAVSDRLDTDLTGYGLGGLAPHHLAPAPVGVVVGLQVAVADAGHLGSGDVRGADAVDAVSADADAAAAVPPADALPRPDDPRAGGAPPQALGADVAVLGRQVIAGAACVGVTVPPDTAPAVAHGIGEALLAVSAEASVGVLVAGDLAAGHGVKPPRPDAAAVADTFDGIVITALDGGRPASLVRLDPALAAASASRAVGALRVLGTVLEGARLGTVVRGSGAPLGVGYVVAQGG